MKNPRKLGSTENVDEILRGPVTTCGQTQGFAVVTIIISHPGDVRIHMEYLNQISNDMNCFEIPTLQIHEINDIEKQRGEGKLAKKKFSFKFFFTKQYVSRHNCWS